MSAAKTFLLLLLLLLYFMKPMLYLAGACLSGMHHMLAQASAIKQLVRQAGRSQHNAFFLGLPAACIVLLLQIVLQQAIDVNSIHYYYLIVEGCVCSCLAVIFMLVVTTQASESHKG